MTESPLGFNIHLAYVDIGKLTERMQQLEPRVVVGFIDSDNDIDKVVALKAALPGTLVVGRAYLDKGVEGKFHLAPEAPGDARYYIAEPDDVVNRWGAMGKMGMSLNVMNEPGTADDAKIKRLVKWTVDALDYGFKTQTALTVLNLATGQPGLNAAQAPLDSRPTDIGSARLSMGQDQWDARFDDVLRALSKYRGLHTLGLHEYMPEAGRIGRFKAMLRRCEVLGIPPPRVVFTEFGWDSAPGEGEGINGYKSRGISGGDYARQQIGLIEGVYRPYLDDGTVVGICTFSYGNSGIWDKYNVEHDEDYWKTLLAWKYQPANKPVNVTPIVVIPSPNPSPSTSSGHSPLHGEGNNVSAPVVDKVIPTEPTIHTPTTVEPIAQKYAKVISLLRQLADELERIDLAASA